MSLLAVTALALAPALPTATPPTAVERPDRFAVCATQATRTRIPVHGSWRIRCVGTIDGNPRVKGRTIPATRTILLKATANPAAARRIAAHELAHAYSLDVLSPAGKQWFARKVGRPAFLWGGTYALRPTEIWANSHAHCAGNGIRGQYVVPCSVLAEATRR